MNVIVTITGILTITVTLSVTITVSVTVTFSVSVTRNLYGYRCVTLRYVASRIRPRLVVSTNHMLSCGIFCLVSIPRQQVS